MIALLIAAALAAGCNLEAPSGAKGCERPAVDDLRMNQIQAVGTHNSYKQAISPRQMALIAATDARQAAALDYAHPPLADQLAAGARQLELDLFYDPDGGRYATPLAMTFAPDLPYDTEPLKAKGFKVLHVQDIDYRSSCARFVDCLVQVRDWSRAHPDHVPLLILLNLKEDSLKIPGAVQALPFDAAAMDAIDAEIAGVFSKNDLITPDQIQGRSATLRDAVATGHAWPRLKDARGRVMFALDAPRRQVDLYRGARTALEGRLAFINIEETSPAAAYITLNDPVAEGARIAAAAKAGLMVRTRADADTVEARANATQRRDAALAGAAQYISTDYMTPDARFGAYSATLPGGAPVRLNPVSR